MLIKLTSYEGCDWLERFVYLYPYCGTLDSSAALVLSFVEALEGEDGRYREATMTTISI